MKNVKLHFIYFNNGFQPYPFKCNKQLNPFDCAYAFINNNLDKIHSDIERKKSKITIPINIFCDLKFQNIFKI